MNHFEAWQLQVKALIKARDYDGAQAQLDAILHRDPDNAEAMDLQREIIRQMTKDDEKNPVVFEGGMRQFTAFVLGAGMCAQPVVTIFMVLYHMLILHHTGPILVATSRAGGFGPMANVPPGALIVGSLVDSCLGLWMVRTAFVSWRNS